MDKIVSLSSLAVPDTVLTRAQETGQSVISTAKSLIITSHSEKVAAVQFRAECIVGPLRELESDFEKPIRLAHEQHKDLIALRRKYTSPFEEAKKVIDGAIYLYDQEVERRQREEHARIVLEQQVAAESAAAEEAARLVSEGQDQQAEEILTELASGTVEPVSSALPMMVRPEKVDGFSGRRLKRFDVINPDSINRKYLVPDMVLIQRVVNATDTFEEAEAEVGGIKVKYVTSYSQRG